MTRRILLALLLALVVGGLVAYSLRSRVPAARQTVAEDCDDKPPPKNEFAMAAECEGDTPPGTGAAGEVQGGGSR